MQAIVMYIPKILSPVYATLFSVSWLMFSNGMTLTWTSPVLPKIIDHTDDFFEYPVTLNQASWITSALTIGAAIGSFLFGYFQNVIGRKYTLLSIGVPMVISYILLALVSIVEVYYVARFLLGLSVGGTFVGLSTYAAEIPSKSTRGSFAYIWSATAIMGFLFSYSVGPYVDLSTFNIILIIFPVCFIIFFGICGAESPQYYAQNGRNDLAKETLRKLRDNNVDIDKEFDEILNKIKEQREGNLTTILRSKSFKKASITTVTMICAQQLCGVNCVQYYSQQIFDLTGANISSEICAIIMGCLQLFGNIVAIFLVDRFDRRTLLTVSGIGIIVCEIPLGIFCYLRNHDYDVDSAKVLPVIALAVFMFVYNLGYGPLPWVLLGEFFPARVKTIAISTVTFVNWIFGFLLTQYFENLVRVVGIEGAFFIFSGCTIVTALFVIFYLVETKGKTLEEIQDDLNK